MTPARLLRPLAEHDHPAVLALVDADRVPGQPAATGERLSEALAGRSPVDSGWWDELDALHHDVAVDDDGHVLGVIASGWRARDTTTVILWCHAGEDTATLLDLIEHALARHPDSDAEAFSFATALGLGLEALPVRHRGATDAALHKAGFTGADTWAYMRRDLAQPAPQPGRAGCTPITVGESSDLDGWQVDATGPDGDRIGQALLARPVDGISVLFWIEVEPSQRGTGLGRRLLDAATDLARTHAATEVILYVDDDDPGSARDRTAATALYRSSGFDLVDRLHSYVRPRTR
ncbi:N-acetyltransferase [Pseudonocardia sp. KRD291]|uniref:GNAT family N-acetyltransferase n=1 Tax=Pseudonocardia sp. KRD291 TaxID=2792007 RepID=UPI001C49D441|nr:GNAT family N-acetyltransferase [Pseudonocardia sp. KRD291]MBW0101512.1 GNAT family N-acetyltransferase [Pseudonocardia sp. KRD291]